MSRAMLVFSLTTCVVLLAVGCNKRSRPSTSRGDSGTMMGTDGGTTTPTDGSMMGTDSGTTTPMDSGTTTPMDSGTTTPVDSGTPPRDSGTTGPRDAGPECTNDRHCGTRELCDDGSCESCRSFPVSPVVGDFYCNESDGATGSCVEACTTIGCVWECLNADTNDNCILCGQANFTACLRSSGCSVQGDCLETCAEDRCGGELCPACETQEDAWSACIEAHATDCSAQIYSCVGLS